MKGPRPNGRRPRAGVGFLGRGSNPPHQLEGLGERCELPRPKFIAVFMVMLRNMSELFVPASTRSSRYCLRSLRATKLVVPPVKLSTYGRRSFTASGQIVWNSLPEYLGDPTLSVDTFRRYLKTYFLLNINIQTTSYRSRNFLTACAIQVFLL